MLHTKFQASKPCDSEEEDFLIFFYVFLWFESTSLDQRPSWTLGPSFEQLGRDPLGNANTKFQASGPTGSEEEEF